MQSRFALALIGVIALFAVGLYLFFIFSSDLGDGLERTLERADVPEKEPLYEAPLDYGSGYWTAFLSGVLGFVIVFLVVYGSGKMISKDAA